MAFSKGDGKIILGTEVDTSGAKKGMLSLKNITQNTGKTFTKLAGAIATAFSVTAIIQFSNESSKLASQTEASVLRLVDIYGQASQAVGDYIDQNAAALGMSKSSAASFSAVYGNLFSVWADQSTNAQLTTEYLRMTAVVASKTGRTMEDVQERIRSGLLGNTEAVEDLGIFVNVKTIEMTEAFQSLADGRSWEQLTAYEQSQVRTLAIMEQATQKYGDQVAETPSLTRARYQAAYEDFQNTWGQVVNTVLMPIMKVATDFLNILTKGLQVLGGISESTITADMYASAIETAAENQNNVTAAVEETAKAQKKALAGFDNLNIVSSSDGETGATAETQAPTIGATASNGNELKNAADEASPILTLLMAVAGAALVAIGIILLVKGGPMLLGLAIGCIVAGLALFAVTVASIAKFDTSEIETTMSLIIGIVAGVVLAIGILMLVFGGPTLKAIGLGLVVGGIAVLGISAAQLAAGELESDTANMIHSIIAIASAAMLAIGIILLFTPASLGLAIGLIAAGAVGLVTEAVLNWDAIVETMRGPLGKIMAIVGASLLVIGILLLFIPGVGWGLGLGLILAGAAALGTAVAFNWDAIIDKVKSITEKIGGFFSKVWDGIKNGFKGMINGIIWLANKWIDGLNFLLIPIRGLIYGIAKAFGSDIKFDDIAIPHIPKLAKGAVIPPNREFLAILGDQKSGTNIEAPLDTIVEAFKAVQGNQSVNINFTGSLAQLARVLAPEITTENRRASVFAK